LRSVPSAPTKPARSGPKAAPPPVDPDRSDPGRKFRALVTFGRMERVSLFHSLVYTGLLICAFALDGPQPITFALGLTHGLIWIGMSITSVLAVRYRVINLRLAVAIALLGCIAPFFGSIEFLRQSHSGKSVAT
jgi:hypothetical protein